MALKVGRIPFLSCEPFYFEMERRGIELYDVVPSAVGAAAASGEIDAGPMPLVDCFQLDERFRLLSGFCVATIRRAVSVVLHSKQPIQALSGARIGIPAEAATSSRLLQVLLALKYQLSAVAYVTLDDAHDAFLLMGNESLRHRHGVRDHPNIYDLGEEWYRWTALPFVFARWIIRKAVDPKEALVLEDMLYVGLQDWADGLFRSSDSRDDLPMHPRDRLEYTQGIRYFIGVPEQRAIDRFGHYLDQLKAL
ncbi:MAG TPA: MqnA/MqnD/SBP family protein [Candidatus Tectomicrobia bacterium]|nr:MqnA/MqnD/SBP family protein [Candidatus Tectomicrobia bacterium]